MIAPHTPALSPPAGLLLRRLAIVQRPYDHPDALALVWAIFEDQVHRYGFADPAQADTASYAPPDGAFLVGYLDGAPMACGGFRSHDQPSDTVEIKKMYTLPEYRRRGLGRAILRDLERRARAGGARRVILETGVRNTGALALYRGLGYQPTDAYVPGRNPEINRAFARPL